MSEDVITVKWTNVHNKMCRVALQVGNKIYVLQRKAEWNQPDLFGVEQNVDTPLTTEVGRKFWKALAKKNFHEEKVIDITDEEEK